MGNTEISFVGQEHLMISVHTQFAKTFYKFSKIFLGKINNELPESIIAYKSTPNTPLISIYYDEIIHYSSDVTYLISLLNKVSS